MGIGSWFRRAIVEEPSPRKTTPEYDDTDQPKLALGITVHFHQCLEVSGTMTFAKDAVAALADRKGLSERGYYEASAQLQRDPGNPVDPRAVSIFVEGEKVGCLPSYVARDLSLPFGASEPARYQLHVLRDRKLLGKAYVWLGDGDPQWTHTAGNPPRLTSLERINSSHTEKSTMVREALEVGGERAQQIRKGLIDGVHYLELIEPIKQLKREGRLKEALILCYKAIEGAEMDSGDREPAPWYTEQAAIVHRKLGQKNEEAAVLKRWLDRCPKARRAGSNVAERLAKLQAK